MARMGWRENNRAKWVGIRPGHYGTAVDLYNSASNGEKIVYTVPAGYVLYISELTFTSRGTAAGADCIARIKTAGGVVSVGLCEHIYGAAGQLSTSRTFFQPIEVPAGYTVGIYSTDASSIGILHFHGWIDSFGETVD